MTDRELLELAAKAAGLNVGTDEGAYDDLKWWNPLTNDADALRLAVRLAITIGPESPDVIGKSLCRASWNNRSSSLGEYGDGDIYAAARRAIVRAAAEIGRKV